MNRDAKDLLINCLGLLLVLVWVLPTAASAKEPGTYISCVQDSAKYAKRSQELQQIKDADQADRPDNQLLPGAQFRDRQRRKRVGEIFGEGCFKEPLDYAAASLVFQHGDHSDHFFQVFLWSKRGAELGDPSQKRMMGLGLDRYLVNVGNKQLFGSQASKAANDSCWCLDPVEPSFLDSLRRQYTGRTLAEALEWVNSLNAGTECPSASQCLKNLKPSPQGTVPGFW